MTKKFDNFVFDLYGTLIDIHTDEHDPVTWERWAEWLDERKIKHDTPENMHDYFFEEDRKARAIALAEWGFKYPEIDVTLIYRDMFEMYGNDSSELTKEFIDEAGFAFRKASHRRIGLFPGVKEFFEKLRREGKSVYILSNAQRCYTWPEICMFGLDKLTDDVLISSDLRCMKPDKAFFKALSDKHSFDLSRTVMFGDSYENDYNGAKSAGWNAVWLANENSPDKFYLSKKG